MNTEKKANKFLIAGGSIFIAAVVAFVLGAWGIASAQPAVKDAVVSDYVYPKAETGTYEFPTFTWQTEGYENLATWWDGLKAKRAEYAGKAEEAIATYGSYLSEEQQNQLRDLENELVSATSFAEIGELDTQFDEVVSAGEAAKADAEALAAQQAATVSTSSGGQYYSNGSGLTKQSGVNYYDGRRETYYSSNVLWHYNTPNWVLGSDGVYRTQDGYVVVAASDLPLGSYVETSFGMAQVLDTGCSPGTTDIYTAW